MGKKKYVRTKYGNIDRITSYDEAEDVYFLENDMITSMSVAKISDNLIDLIEVGDIVNGLPVARVETEKDRVVCDGIYVAENHYFNEHSIKAILTHERYERNVYKVKGDDE